MKIKRKTKLNSQFQRRESNPENISEVNQLTEEPTQNGIHIRAFDTCQVTFHVNIKP